MYPAHWNNCHCVVEQAKQTFPLAMGYIPSKYGIASWTAPDASSQGQVKRRCLKILLHHKPDCWLSQDEMGLGMPVQ